MNKYSNENTGIIERIKEFIDYKGITVNKFETSSGIARGYLARLKGSVGSDKLNNILAAFPELSSDWLLTGNGPMLKTAPSATIQQSGQNAHYQGTFTEPINTIMGSGNTIGTSAKEIIARKKAEKGVGAQPEAIQLRHENQILNVEIERLKAEIEHLKTSLELKDSIIKAKDDMIQILMEKK